ncbi:hypothetical protein A3B61_04700 [Candidatus Peribacteria bacterium RIFCSPLOWO2_01_FULL_53_10]|nr:MAG: hypothetical protein A3B61_04700 [Candidatus Peribacteria bacterium RIFCSPLOWO2_01_FULL_53_10]
MDCLFVCSFVRLFDEDGTKLFCTLQIADVVGSQKRSIGFGGLDKCFERTAEVVISREQKNVIINLRISYPLRDCAEGAEFVVVVAGVLYKDREWGVGRSGDRELGLPLMKCICKNCISTDCNRNVVWNLLDEVREDGFARKRQERLWTRFREGPEAGSKSAGEDEGFHRGEFF